jgi:hypothetical protein
MCSNLADPGSRAPDKCAVRLRGWQMEQRVAAIAGGLLVTAFSPTTVPLDEQLCLS